MSAGDSYQTIRRCNEIHNGTKRWLKMLTWLLVLLSGLMIGAAQQSYTASSRSREVQIQVESQKGYLQETLSQIRDDVREIRANQRELMIRNRESGQ